MSQEIVQHDDAKLVESCELAYGESLNLTQYKDVIRKIGFVTSELKDLEGKMRIAQRNLKTLNLQRTSLISLVQIELSNHISETEDAGDDA